MRRQRKSPRRAEHVATAGFTLTELLVVVAIIATLAAVALPMLSRDSTNAAFDKHVRMIADNLRRMRIEAIASREDRALTVLDARTYELQRVVDWSGTKVASRIIRVRLPPEVLISGVATCAAAPGSTGCNPPSSLSRSRVLFSAVSNVSTSTGTLDATPRAGTIYLRSDDGSRKARVIVYQATGYSRQYEGW